MRRQLFLFVRPPRPLWPFNSSSSAFWPPLAFASMAAGLREQVQDLEVRILDAPVLEMGWRTLTMEVERQRPDFVGIGEEAVSCVEGFRIARLARACGARVIAGGCFFGQVAAESLLTGLIDVVVHGEGEETVVEVVEAMRGGSEESLEKVAGISFLRGDSGGSQVVRTRPRRLIKDLNTLPLPAYDLLPVERYGRTSANHPRLASIELGRGCFGSCDFCVLWRQMGKITGNQVVPQLRLKSVERLLEEVRLLVRRYGRGYLGWVDPCFNADPEVPGRLGEQLLREGLAVGQSAWMRTDALARDAGSGALACCVEAGLNEIYVGIERPDDEGLANLGKNLESADATKALGILRERFPSVTVIGSFIYGLPGDTGKTVRSVHRLAMDLELDQFFLIPLTPLPGTTGWRPEMWDGTGERFREFSFLPTGRVHGQHARLERALMWSVLTQWSWIRVRSLFRVLLGLGGRRARIRRRLWLRGARLHLGRVMSRLRGRKSDSLGMVFPRWYES